MVSDVGSPLSARGDVTRPFTSVVVVQLSPHQRLEKTAVPLGGHRHTNEGRHRLFYIQQAGLPQGRLDLRPHPLLSEPPPCTKTPFDIYALGFQAKTRQNLTVIWELIDTFFVIFAFNIPKSCGDSRPRKTASCFDPIWAFLMAACICRHVIIASVPHDGVLGFFCLLVHLSTRSGDLRYDKMGHHGKMSSFNEKI